MEESKFERILGWNIPQGMLPCWVISDDERLNALKKSEPFYDYTPTCHFKITQRLDNNFIHGYLAHNSYNGKRFHNEINRSYTYLENYQTRKPVYISFDRVAIYKLIEIIPTNPLTFVLRRLDEPKAITINQAFMIMPFKFDELNEFYKSGIKEFLKNELQINILRADDFSDNDIIIDTIYRQIEQAEFIIADTSHCNKNAFFEFGYAVGNDKEIITIQNTDIEQSLFFDRAHVRAILYSLKNIGEFQQQLKNTVAAIRGKVASKN